MAGYIGRQPLSEAIQSRVKYTAIANQQTFSFAYQAGFVDVFLNGIKLEDTTDYTATNGTDIVLTSGAIAGQVLEAVGLTTFSLVNGKINYTADQAPAVTDDSSQGYRIGSMWIDTTNDEAYRCVDDLAGSAVWIGTTLETTDLGSLAMVSPTGTGSSTTFLRGDNSWTTVDTDLTSDTSPQLGGDLDTNGNDIKFKDNDKATFGDLAGGDLQIYHDGTSSIIKDAGQGNLKLQGTNINIQDSSGWQFIECLDEGFGGSVKIYHGGFSQRLITTGAGVDINGGINLLGTGGNVTLSGTVDGRDVAADGTKLDTVATSANNYSHPATHAASMLTGALPAIDGSSLTGIDALPTQTGHTGKYLGTDGSAATWNTLDTDANSTTKGLYEHANTISANYSITSGNNAMTAGPITINTGVSVSIPSGSTWVIA